MQSSTKRLSVIGIALLLAACADTVGSGEPSERTDREPTESTGKTKAAERKTDTRDTLTGVSSDERQKRTTKDLLSDARAYASKIATRAGVTNPRFGDLHVAQGVDGLMHVRLEQKHLIDGSELKVWGADVVVHATETELVGLNGSLAPHIEDRFPTNAMTRNMPLPESDILPLAKSDQFGTRSVPTSRDQIERIIYVDAEGASHLAFHTTFYNELVDGIAPGLWNHVLDAKTGELLAKWNGIDTVSQASGPGGNPKITHSWTNELDVEDSGNGTNLVMTTPRLRTLNMSNSQTGNGTDIKAPLDGFNDAAVNDAHGYAEITLTMLKEWMGHDSIDDAGFRIVSRVHYGVNYENAFWNGVQMTYGDGKNTFYPLSGALDVVAHEIHHGFTTKHSNLAYSGEPGGLNESFSDIAGKTAEFFYKQNANWDLGGDIFKSNGALRYMCNPSRDGRSIDNASQMTPTLDPHYSSGPSNKAFCRLSKRLSSSGDAEGTATRDGVRRAASAFYLANASYWTSSTTFVQGCQGTVDAARALGFSDDEVAAVKSSWVDVGVYCDGLAAPPPPCDVTLTDAAGELTSPNYPEPYTDSFNKTWCIDAPSGDATVTFTDFETESGYDFVSVGDKTGRIISKTSGTTKPTAVTSSRVYVIFKTDASVTKKGWKATWSSQ
jgi:Zn-dependent metalloprotease